MKVALINTPISGLAGILPQDSPYPPLGLGYIAACLRRAGHEAKIYSPMPFSRSLEKMFKSMERFGPDMIGLGAVTPSFMVARRLVPVIKERFKCLVIMGGPHVTAIPESALRAIPGLDAVIRGEGEIPVLAIADEHKAAGKVDFSRIPGAAFMEAGSYRETPRPEFITDLDSLPYPVRDLADSMDSGHYEGPLDVFTSRGCPSRCTFCANICMGRKFRPRTPAKVVEELAFLVEKCGVTKFDFRDDYFTADPRRAIEICDLIIARKLNISWFANGKVSALRNEELVAKLKRAGCTGFLLGIESGDQRILDLMKKGTTLAMAEECCAVLRKYGLVYMNEYILGNEGDTLETVFSTISFSKKLKSWVTVLGPLVPIPGTEVFEKYYKDFDRPDTDWAAWCSFLPIQPYNNRHTELSKTAVFFLSIWAYVRTYFDPAQLLRITQRQA